MLNRIETDLTMTPRARQRIQDEVAAAGFPAVAGLLYGRDESSQEEGWRIGIYDRQEIESSTFGAVLIVLDDFELVLPQPSFLVRLQGMRLDWDRGRYSVSLRP